MTGSMQPQQGEINTDPRFIYADDANVIAYRLGIVETDLGAMNLKLDRIINEYPTHNHLSLILDPIKEKLRELENERKQELIDKTKQQQSYKLAVFSSIASPIMMVIIMVVMANSLGLKA